MIVVVLYRLGFIGADRTLALFGPALMIRTKRGRGFLDRIGRFRRGWTAVSDLGIWLAAIAMVVIVAVLVFDAYVVSRIPASAAPPLSEALALPGINPIIPLGYGLVALVVGVVVHELFHGFVARSQNIGVKSLGVLWCVIPVGAFVEQDDEQMSQAPRRKRDRVAAAGVLANFALTVAFFVAIAALVSTSVAPNAAGVGLTYIVPGTPAANVSLAAGDILTSLNGSSTPTNQALVTALTATHAGQTVSVTYVDTSSVGHTTPVTLASLGSWDGVPADNGKGFLGVAPSFLTPAELRATFVFPPTSNSNALVGLSNWLVLPLAGLQPIQGSTAGFYHMTGPLAGADAGTFWIVVNLLYWLAWINLLLGLSNALPLVPLDGGLLFRDFSASIVARFRRSWDTARLEKFAGRAVGASSAIVLVLLLWLFVVPRL